MIGTLLNITTVLAGGTIGLLFGSRFSDGMRKTVVAGLGLFTLAYGIFNFLKTQNPIIVLGSLLVGALLGEWWQVEQGLQNFGKWLESRFSRVLAGRSARGSNSENETPPTRTMTPSKDFVRGFLTASLVFCVGPMTILGSIQDGLSGDYSLLAIKSVLDGFAALAFASTLGVGVLFSVLVILVFQGGISLLAGLLSTVVTPAMMAEMTAVGGVLLLGIALSSLLEIKPIRVGNFLPALAIAPLVVAILAFLGINSP
jgi:uncharacterized membrane protein YqgA involved in biofilm formation